MPAGVVKEVAKGKQLEHPGVNVQRPSLIRANKLHQTFILLLYNIYYLKVFVVVLLCDVLLSTIFLLF